MLNAQGIPIGLLDRSIDSMIIERSIVRWGHQPELACIQALWDGAPGQITEVCPFTVAHRLPRTLHVQLSPDVFLVNGYQNLSLVDVNGTRPVPRCAPCLITLSCSAQLHDTQGLLIPSPVLCNPRQESPDIAYPVNRALLDTFYDDDNDTALESLRNQPPELPPLNLTAYNSEASQRAASDTVISYSMKKLAAAMQNDSVILHTPAEALIYDFVHAEKQTVISQWLNWTNLFFMLFAIMAVIRMLASFSISTSCLDLSVVVSSSCVICSANRDAAGDYNGVSAV